MLMLMLMLMMAAGHTIVKQGCISFLKIFFRGRNYGISRWNERTYVRNHLKNSNWIKIIRRINLLSFPLWRKADFGIVAVSELFSIPSDLEKLRYGDNHKHFSVCVYDIIFSVAQNGNLIYKNFKEAKSLCFRNPIRKER
jgi:hypothetical protein